MSKSNISPDRWDFFTREPLCSSLPRTMVMKAKTVELKKNLLTSGKFLCVNFCCDALKWLKPGVQKASMIHFLLCRWIQAPDTKRKLGPGPTRIRLQKFTSRKPLMDRLTSACRAQIAKCRLLITCNCMPSLPFTVTKSSRIGWVLGIWCSDAVMASGPVHVQGVLFPMPASIRRG